MPLLLSYGLVVMRAPQTLGSFNTVESVDADPHLARPFDFEEENFLFLSFRSSSPSESLH